MKYLLPILVLTSVAIAEPLKWPEGKGRDLIKQNCLICHSGELIMGQRLSVEKWTKEVEKMAGWGSPIPAEEKAALVEYLGEHFSIEKPLPKPTREKFKF